MSEQMNANRDHARHMHAFLGKRLADKNLTEARETRAFLGVLDDFIRGAISLDSATIVRSALEKHLLQMTAYEIHGTQARALLSELSALIQGPQESIHR